MANENNLQPSPSWESGQSGNPKGRKHGTINMKTRIERVLDMCASELEKSGEFPEKFIEDIRAIYGESTIANAMVIKMISNAILKSDSERGMRDLLDRVEGKPIQAIDLDPHGALPDMSSEAMNIMTMKEALQKYQQMMKDTTIVIDAEPEEKDVDDDTAKD